MPTLFGRTAVVTVGVGAGQALRITDLDVEFKVSKDLDPEPNTATVRIYNLSASSRKAIESVEETLRWRLEAGYGGETSVLFEGDIRKASSSREGPDIVTTIEGGDGERAYRGSRVNRSFGPGTSLRSVIERVGETMALGVGNLAERAATSGFEGLGNVFSEGVVVSGPSARELTGLLAGSGLEWSVQDGTLQVLPRLRALAGTAVLLSARTGLVDSPSVDSEGVVKATTLLVPDLFPGRRVRVESEFVRGTYRTTKAEYVGKTDGNEWFISIEGEVERAG